MHDFFLGRVEIMDTGCWLWKGTTNSWGYGRTRTSLTAERATHRIAYVLHVGTIPNGTQVLHRCDTPRCCNPHHLFLGSQSENVADAVAKGRQFIAKGEAHGKAKLTAERVHVLRENPAARSISDWAREFGVSRRAIRLALDGSTWS